MESTITFNHETFKEFKKEYSKAVINNQEIFIFQGKELLTAYAKYIIEYINSKLN
jgi:hypothetical protein